jgi:hypothetical protein
MNFSAARHERSAKTYAGNGNGSEEILESKTLSSQ